ncbi:MAG: CAP domain-containing protein [Rhodomicrobium sp.]
MLITIRQDKDQSGTYTMVHAVRVVLICLALGGCASSGVFSSLSTLGGGGDTAKPVAVSNPAPAPAETGSSGSGLGGVWKNFSSAFSSGAQPVSQKTGDLNVQALDANAALRLINDYRSTKGLAPLSLDPQAAAAAEVLVKDMAKHDHMSHVGPNGQNVGQRLLAAGYSYGLAAENVGVGQPSAEEAIEGWKKSPANSRNMLLPGAKHVGIAYEYKPDTQHKTFWALVVAAP